MTSSPFTSSTVWVVIPAHNNAGTVRDVALGCRGIVPNVLIVDDGSRDADIRALMSDTDIPVIRHESNRGKGAALLTAAHEVEKRGGATMISIDADGQHYPDDLRAFLPVIQAEPDAIVIGERDMVGPNIPGRSRFGRSFSDFWLRLETGLSIRDTQSGFRAYPVRHLLALPIAGRKFDFEVEVLALAAWAGLPILNVPIRVWYPPAAERITSFHPFLDNLWLTHRHALLVMRRLLPFPHRKLASLEQPTQKQRGNALGFWFFTTALRFTGLKGAYGLLYFVCAWYALFDTSIVRSALAYLKRRFPAHGPLRQRWNIYQLFIAQGRCLIDRYYLVHGGDRLRFHRQNFEAIAPLVGGKTGFVLLTAHVGNWQCAMVSLEHWNKTVHLLMRQDEHDLRTKMLGLYRQANRIGIIDPTGYLGGVIGVMNALDAGDVVSVMGDRDYNTSRKVAVEFFGAAAEFPCSGFLFAHAARVPLAVLFSAKTGTCDYEVRIAGIIEPRPSEPKAAFLRRGAQEYAALLEGYLQLHPFQCFLFQDVWTNAASPSTVSPTSTSP